MSADELPLVFNSHKKRRRSKVHFPSTRPAFVFDFTEGLSFSREVAEEWHFRSFGAQAIQLDALPFTTLAQRPLSGLEADWLQVAVSLYAADRFAPRRPHGLNFWRRKIRVTLPVSCPEKWDSLKAKLTLALGFLTEDDWEFHFQKRNYELAAELQQHFASRTAQPLDWAALCSGGLDSIAGALSWLETHGGNCLLASGFTNYRLRDGQMKVIEQLETQVFAKLSKLSVEYGLPLKSEPHGMESTQRCRGWIHVALGLLSAKLAGLEKLHVFENGIGAFNLPCESSQSGSQSSRAMHPVFLSRIAQIASALFDTKLTVSHPFAFSTKAEMLLAHRVDSYRSTLLLSFSCEKFPNYKSRNRQCGTCPSCLIRRAALHGAGIVELGADYSWDVLSRGVHPTLGKSVGLHKIEMLAHRLRCCAPNLSAWEKFVAEFPEFALYCEESARFFGLSEQEFLLRFLGLHHRFTKEWDAFARSIPRLRKSTLRLAA